MTFSNTKRRIKSMRFAKGICECINNWFYFDVSYFNGSTFLTKLISIGGKYSV